MDRFLVRGPQMKVGGDKESGASRKRRKYDSEYLNLGFTFTGPEDAPLPQRVICSEKLANDSMRPCKLRRHIETKHQSLKGKPRDFFERKLHELRSQIKVIETQQMPWQPRRHTAERYALRRRGNPTTLAKHCSSLLPKICAP